MGLLSNDDDTQMSSEHQGLLSSQKDEETLPIVKSNSSSSLLGSWIQQNQEDAWAFSFDTERMVRIAKYALSLALLGFCLNIIGAGIAAGETPVAKLTNPIVAFLVMWILILWLGILEGGQGSLVGLQPIDSGSYRESHTFAHSCTSMVYKGDNLNRFIVGRQFLVVLVVFLMNLCCTVVEDAVVPGFNKGFMNTFLESGLAVMIITVILGQLAAEVNATNCMLDFINTPIMVATTWFCLAIESSGLLHATYLVRCFFSLFTSTSIEESPRSNTEKLWFWVRVAFSSALLLGSFVVTWSAILNDQTTMYEGLPKIVSIAMFIGLTCFLGILEAMQIAVFAVVKLPEKELAGYPVAQDNCELVFRGNNFKAFLIGRQICVTASMFLLARISTTDVDPAAEETVMGMSSALQDFFNTGLPGALITTIVASLVWRIVASSFPIPFLSNPVVYLTIRICLMLEASGVFSAAWLLADLVKLLMGFQPDDTYLDKNQSRCFSRSDTDLESGSSTSFDVDDGSETLSTTYGATTRESEPISVQIINA